MLCAHIHTMNASAFLVFSLKITILSLDYAHLCMYQTRGKYRMKVTTILKYDNGQRVNIKSDYTEEWH